MIATQQGLIECISLVSRNSLQLPRHPHQTLSKWMATNHEIHCVEGGCEEEEAIFPILLNLQTSTLLHADHVVLIVLLAFENENENQIFSK